MQFQLFISYETRLTVDGHYGLNLEANYMADSMP